ncbi:hypothetical protein ARMGADRAFT_730462 [Armillaria gallica]|uniref:Uncharacterized protein n=1 Tax=Armillaria gallica TaxID=47427 RepID=A0A2H3CTS1_ARMGA|nr:hypothetical protein ARMGADRAFT_730462 [Armillaria gallica]
MEIIKEFGMDENSTDAILWAKIRNELDKRSLPPTIDSISLSKVNVAVDKDSHDHLQISPNVSTVTPTAESITAQKSTDSASSPVGGFRDVRNLGSYHAPTGDEENSDSSTPDNSGSPSGNPEFRKTLASRIYSVMSKAWKGTEKRQLSWDIRAVRY